MKSPRTLSDIRKHPAVEKVKKEYDDGSRYSYWVYLKKGWINPLMECRVIHEKTVRDVCDQFQSVHRV